jgi:2-polyprenyl-3-methyl-5-hydroxy-6-metoxy-1,4-benzoquinol methylase
MSNTADRELADVKDLFNAKAPTWNAKYVSNGPLTFRVAAFQRLLLERLPVNSRVLDLGCGTGAIASALSASGFRVTACDIAEEMIEAGKAFYGRAGIEWCVLPANWKNLPFDPCSFDAIIASSVLEYLPDVATVLAECQRTLAGGGIMIATVPNLRTLTRKLEGLARPVAVLLNKFAGMRWLRRLYSYTTYLKCSRNRLSPEEWRAVGTQVQFAAVDPIKGDGRNESLVFLVFSKTPKAGQ